MRFTIWKVCLFSMGQNKPNIDTRWVAVDLMDFRATQMSIKLMETWAWKKNTFSGFFLLTGLWPNGFLFVSEWEETCQQIMHRTCRACRYVSSLLLSVHPCESSWNTTNMWCELLSLVLLVQVFMAVSWCDLVSGEWV